MNEDTNLQISAQPPLVIADVSSCPFIQIPPIVTDEIWDKVQQRFRDNVGYLNNTKHDYLFKSKMRCVKCKRMIITHLYGRDQFNFIFPLNIKVFLEGIELFLKFIVRHFLKFIPQLSLARGCSETIGNAAIFIIQKPRT